MTVGIVGAGRMGQALACALALAGNRVVLVRGRVNGDQRPPDLAGHLPQGARMVLPDQLWQQASVVLLAVPFPVAMSMMSGPAGRYGGGRTLIDTTNPGFGPSAVLPAGSSGGEQIAAAASTWRVAKAFNTVPARHLRACHMHGRPISLPVAGMTRAKTDAFALAQRLGFAPIDAGGIAASRELEALAMLLASISSSEGLQGRIGIQIGQPEARWELAL